MIAIVLKPPAANAVKTIRMNNPLITPDKLLGHALIAGDLMPTIAQIHPKS